LCGTDQRHARSKASMLAARFLRLGSEPPTLRSSESERECPFVPRPNGQSMSEDKMHLTNKSARR
jgi:hypothetical protein